MAKEKGKEIITSPEGWDDSGEEAFEFVTGKGKMLRYRRLNYAEARQIDIECTAPIPTSINPTWIKAPTDENGKLILGSPVPNDTHPEYIKHLESLDLENKRRVMFIDRALIDFKIPGENWEQKRDWVGKRLVFDVVALYCEIQEKTSLRQREIDFFS